MSKSTLCFYISMLALAIIVLLIEAWSVRFMFVNYGLFKTILVVLIFICFDSFALTMWFIDME